MRNGILLTIAALAFSQVNAENLLDLEDDLEEQQLDQEEMDE